MARILNIMAAISRWTLLCLLTVAIGGWACWQWANYCKPFPIRRLSQWPRSILVTDAQGNPMVQQVAANDQWCIPVALDQTGPWLAKATIAVEDAQFYNHPGIDPMAVIRATWQNLRYGRVISGASTLTMQLCRMMDDRPRTVQAKAVESFRALQLEQIKTKKQILQDYLNMAPYGGNLRGVEAAARFYFAKSAKDLSLAESALLAGIPQSPARFRPDQNPTAITHRRDFVLQCMLEHGMINNAQAQTARAQQIDIHRGLFGRRTSHAGLWALTRHKTGGQTTIDNRIQQAVWQTVDQHHRRMPRTMDIAVVVIDIPAASVPAMIGSADPTDPVDGQVNGALAWRSPGSTLKPFVYAAAFQAGRLAPTSLIDDLPIQRGAWRPVNFDRKFHGRVTATHALQQSLNIPAILVAEGVGLTRCRGVMEAAGIRFADNHRNPGLAMVTGAVETRLLDLTNAYATLGRLGEYRPLRIFPDERSVGRKVIQTNTCRALNDMLASDARRPINMLDLAPSDVPWFVWKTGTSSGRRDAWAIGHNHQYAIGVWVGHFNGQADPQLVGRNAAEPLLADLFNLPALRTSQRPTPARPIQVHRPLPRPRECQHRLAIVSPDDNLCFLANPKRARISLKANQPVQWWFINGKLVQPGPDRSIHLPPGSYQLRAVTGDGQFDTTVFTVTNQQILAVQQEPTMIE